MTQVIERTNFFETLLSPQGIADPYPLYAQMRRDEPVYWNEAMQLWMLFRYSDISAALQDKRLSSNWPSTYRFARELTQEEEPFFKNVIHNFFELWMQASDAPRHTRIRGLVQKAFTPKMLQRLQLQVKQITTQLLDAVAERGHMDVMTELAQPLPATIIAEMLGVPHSYREQFSHATQLTVAFIGNSNPAPGQLEETDRAIRGVYDFLQPLIEERRHNPGQDLISDLLQGEQSGEDILTPLELMSNSLLLLIAGHETTTNLIGNGLLALLQNPEQMQKLRNEPTLIKSAVEEFLRYNSPVQWVPRQATVDMVIGNQLIEKGQGVWVCLGSANHDPDYFSDPERLNVTRQEGRHLTFGYGIHHCLGAALARMEGQIVFSELLSRFENIRYTGGALEWNANFTIRSLKSLPISFQARY
jgi:pimeloyl-[acyl-carrier protein] synthase